MLQLHVQPGAKRSQFAGMHGERMKVRIAAPAADGRANAALIEFLADHYGVPRRNVTIESGASARQKRVAITGVSKP